MSLHATSGDTRDPAPSAAPVTASSPDRLGLWEDLLTLVLDPDSPRVVEREAKRRLLSFLLQRSGLEEPGFWSLPRSRRGRQFLSRFSALGRDLPRLEVSAFDLDKALKERFRREPLTVGSAWHHGYWRSYFSHAAITHPANDGLREEFSTAWNLLRKEPAILFRREDGEELRVPTAIRLEMPILVGPLPWTDGLTLERAYLEAMRRSDPGHDLAIRTLVVVTAANLARHADGYEHYAADLLPRLSPAEAVEAVQNRGPLARLVGSVRIVELTDAPGLEAAVAELLRARPELLLSVYLEEVPQLLERAEAAAALPGVAMLQVFSGEARSYELVPRLDAHLKARCLRARVQLVSAGGAGDTHASAASVYEAVLLGANGGAITHIAAVTLLPELIDVLRGADDAAARAALAARAPGELADLAADTLCCWQHSILDFLSCMGIDDIQKTSGNSMAITMTAEWLREVDALATPEFGEINRALNAARVAAEPLPSGVRGRYRVSELLRELAPDLALVPAARMLAQEGVNYHLANTNRSLTADHLEVIYRMAAGCMPEADEFFIEGDMGPESLDGIGVRVSREAVEASLRRLKRDPASLDYINLAVSRGLQRPGALPPGTAARLLDSAGQPLAAFTSDEEGGFEVALAGAPADGPLTLAWTGATGGGPAEMRLDPVSHDPAWELPDPLVPEQRRTAPVPRALGVSVRFSSENGLARVLEELPGSGRLIARGAGIRAPVYTGPVNHASISLGAASEDFLKARIEGNAGLSITSSGEGGPLRFDDPGVMTWESIQAASGHFGITAADLRRVRDVEIKINQGAKPGKGGRLSGAKVTLTVSRARNIPPGTDALSPDPKHDIYSIEDMPAEVLLWLLFHVHCGIKITGSNYTRYVAAGMWSNFVVDYLLVDSGLGGSGNYHADSSHVGWPDIFRTILHTHHALVNERVPDPTGTRLVSVRDGNGWPYGAQGSTRLLASGGLRGELDMLKVLLAGADALVEASIGKAVAFGCNQCGNCHLDCPRGGITTRQELTQQNDRGLMRRRFRNWTVLNMTKLAVLIDAINLTHGWLDEAGRVHDASRLLDDVRKLRGRTDLLEMPRHPAPPRAAPLEVEHDSCRVGSLAVSEPVDVAAIQEAARLSWNGGNNRGGGIDFAGFAPAALRERTCLILNTIGPDRRETFARMLEHMQGLEFFDAQGLQVSSGFVREHAGRFAIPVRERYRGERGYYDAGFREPVGDFHVLFTDLRPGVLARYAETLLASPAWLQRAVKYSDLPDEALRAAALAGEAASRGRLRAFVRDVREEYFTALAHLLDSRYYRTHGIAPAGKFAAKRQGYVVSAGQDLGAIKVSGWAQVIPEYFDLSRFWEDYPGARESGGVELRVRGVTTRTAALHAHVWGMHHRYPTNSPAIDAEGRGNPAGAHPFRAYNVLLMHNGEQVGVDSTSPFLMEFGRVHTDASMGPGAALYEGDSVYERKYLTDTEYAAFLVDFTRRVLGLTTAEATQIISPLTGLDLDKIEEPARTKLRALMTNYVQLTPTGPYKFTILESRPGEDGGRVGFRENMDIKFLRPHEIVANFDTGPAQVRVVANGSEAKIADAMLRALRAQGVLGDPGADRRFNMRPGGRPGMREFGGVVEAFVHRDTREFTLRNRFGEEVEVPRAGSKLDPRRNEPAEPGAAWQSAAREAVRALIAPSDLEMVTREVLGRVRDISLEEYRWFTEQELPALARRGDDARARALVLLAELRKRLSLADLGGKSLSSMEYLTDGGSRPDGSVEGGLYRVLSEVPRLWDGYGRSRHLRIDRKTRDDLRPPADAARDVLVVDGRDFLSEGFTPDVASRFLTEVTRRGWKRIVVYNLRGGPRCVGVNLPGPDGAPAADVEISLFGRESGDFCGALLEGATVLCYGQGQSHVGMKAASGTIFVLQDILNTGCYAAHGGTMNVWDSGSRFAVAGQNKVLLDDAVTPAQGLKTVHFGSPNEYAFEYLMSGGDNSFHVVLGFEKPDEKGRIALKPTPYAGKFFMSGAAAGRVMVFDPRNALDPAQHAGNRIERMSAAEWSGAVAPFLATEFARRGIPLRVRGEELSLWLDGAEATFVQARAFKKLVPIKQPSPMVAGD